MNFFGLKTVYNITKVMNDNFYVLSLDFIKPGQFYYSSTELNDDLPFFAVEKIEGQPLYLNLTNNQDCLINE